MVDVPNKYYIHEISWNNATNRNKIIHNNRIMFDYIMHNYYNNCHSNTVKWFLAFMGLFILGVHVCYAWTIITVVMVKLIGDFESYGLHDWSQNHYLLHVNDRCRDP
jgi:hypothetical protein